MPTYQYRCTDCGESFERHQSFSDDPITVCPLPREGEALNGAGSTCGGEVRKIFSNVGISFKGSGFYRNDSRPSSSSDSSGSSESGSSSSSTTSESPSKESTSSESGSSNDKSSSTVGAASASG
ncbi:FmdB family zinc ribbon protein [Candidatus Poriferisodalis sp.]|uniref:FmdB family zinc ribbon protein n=1 Tax=Candidatus Poriferisodalis sp. TaxID=3101277 RepID=UPI003B5CFA7F